MWNGQERVTALATRDSGHMGEVILCAKQRRLAADIAALGHWPRRLCCSSIGIPVVQDLPGVGANLQDHLQIRSVYKIKGDQDSKRWGLSLNTMANSIWGKARIGQYALRQTGPMSMAPSQLGAFTRSSPDQLLAQYPVPRAAAVTRRVWRAAARVQRLYRQRLQPEPDRQSRSVRIKSGQFGDAPAISPNYLSTPEDRQGGG